MVKTALEKFIEAINPFLPLWESVRLSGIAVYSDARWFNVGIRVQLEQKPPTDRSILSPDQRLLYYVMDYRIDSLSHLMGQLINADFYRLQNNSEQGGGTFADIWFAKPPQNSPQQPARPSWHGPMRREPSQPERTAGVRYTSITMGASGEMIHNMLDYDLRQRVDSSVRLAEPGYDGLEGLARHLFPGTTFANWQHALMEIIAPLPFEIEFVGNGKVAVRAPSKAPDDSLTVRCFYTPHTGAKPLRIVLKRADAKHLNSATLQWEENMDWPPGSEQAKVTLFYHQEEIQSIQLSRRAIQRADRLKATQARLERAPSPVTQPTQTTRSAVAVGKKEMPIFKTALEIYRASEIIGEGGAGVVYKAQTDDGQAFAIKCLDPRKATKDKRKRFKIELQFCAKNNHKNIVTVLDQGITSIKGEDSPFYVMPYYSATLRHLMSKSIPRERVIHLFSQILNGIEAAHLKGVWHRDLKPENVLWDASSDSLVVADFGVAHFAEEDLYTLVETGAHDRLGNFLYAAPEQRARGKKVDQCADIFSLGLMLNEMFTGHVPQGSGITQIGHVDQAFAYLDEIVDGMIRQLPQERPQSIDEIKRALIAKGNEFISRQKLDALQQTVVPSSAVIDPLVENPIQVADFDVRGDTLVAILNQAPPPHWIEAFTHPRAMSFIPGTAPANWRFVGREAMVTLLHAETQALQVANYFKEYIRSANLLYRELLENAARQQEENERRALKQKIEEEERRQRILRTIRS